ncbi:MAG: HNH endonuclease [Acidobacteriota bacterium]
MRGFIANTDYDWFTFLRAIEPPADEVNFWRPGSEASTFRVVQPGEPIFFRLKKPHYAIAGFGYFAHFSQLPVSIVWETYGVLNGAPSFGDMRTRLAHYRSRMGKSADLKSDFWIGCILVDQPVFFREEDWVREPEGFPHTGAMQGKSYDLTSGEGERVWMECLARATPAHNAAIVDSAIEIPGGYGAPALFRTRLGQRSFRIAILDSYGRRCSVTGERTLPVLEAAHIRDFATVQTHSIDNGLLLRSDLHKLFDTGYVTVTPDYHFLVSRRIREEFENGRDYYALSGQAIRLPENPVHRPMSETLSWHNEEKFLG